MGAYRRKPNSVLGKRHKGRFPRQHNIKKIWDIIDKELTRKMEEIGEKSGHEKSIPERICIKAREEYIILDILISRLFKR